MIFCDFPAALFFPDFMIESDLGLVFHTRFPRSDFPDFAPARIVQELW